LRRRFGNALHWYAVLINAKELHIKGYLESARLDFQSNSEKHASGTEDMNQCSDTLSNESSSDKENSQPSPGIPGKMHIASYAFVFNHHYPKLLSLLDLSPPPATVGKSAHRFAQRLAASFGV
jgi:hypothetical protein